MPISQMPLVNPLRSHVPSRGSPATRAVPVAASDAADLATYAKALRVFNPAGAAATVRVTYAEEANDQATVDLVFPPGLTIEPSAVRRVWKTGTGAGLSIIAYQG